MKTKTVYVDEITGQEFESEFSAIMSERVNKDIKDSFAFWTKNEDMSCGFSNGKYAVLWNKEVYDKLINIFNSLLMSYEPNVYKEAMGKLENTNELIDSYYVNRVLDDTGSYLNGYLYRIKCVCPNCFREYGQLYYKLHCTCSDSIETIKGELK